MYMKKEHLCEVCGEKDPQKFYKSRKNKCKKCMSDSYKIREDKSEYVDKQKKWVSKNLIKYRVLSAKHRAIRDNLDFEITEEIIQKKLEEQNHCCFISKVPISMEQKNWYSLSLDRIDSNKGYTIDNTIIVTKFVNISKNEMSLDEFIKLLKETCNNLD